VRVCVPYIYKIKNKKIIYTIGLRCAKLKVQEKWGRKTKAQLGCGLRFKYHDMDKTNYLSIYKSTLLIV
jgi:hypothetical protein